MGHKTFIGGVHPYDGKELSKDSPIKEVLPKGDMVYPVSQHIGAPAKPVVAVGDTVLKGQMIAEAGGFVSSPIYSSVSGKVKAIEKRRVAVGDMVDSIVIENDGMFTETTYKSVEDVTALSKEEIIEKVKNAGVVGMAVPVSLHMLSFLQRSRTRLSILSQTAQSVSLTSHLTTDVCLRILRN